MIYGQAYSFNEREARLAGSPAGSLAHRQDIFERKGDPNYAKANRYHFIDQHHCR